MDMEEAKEVVKQFCMLVLVSPFLSFLSLCL